MFFGCGCVWQKKGGLNLEGKFDLGGKVDPAPRIANPIPETPITGKANVVRLSKRPQARFVRSTTPSPQPPTNSEAIVGGSQGGEKDSEH